MFGPRVFAVFSAALAVGALAALPGCDWLQSSDPAQRSSPVIGSLRIEPSSVLCEGEFSVSFHFEDPQGDLAFARITLQRAEDEVTREELFSWPEATSKSSGTVPFTLSFEPKPCTGQGGIWKVTVEAEDEQGHTSNTLTGQINLAAAG